MQGIFRGPRVKILITAGPTREAIDDIRFLSNRSSGRMGRAVAVAAADRGHEVTLMLGEAASVAAPSGSVRTVRFDSTADLQTQLASAFPAMDVLVMAAAVSDFVPVRAEAGTKLDRRDGPVMLTLHPAPDLVAEIATTRQPHQIIVGFALEPKECLLARARAKLARKGLDAIVANPIQTMEASHIDGTLLMESGSMRRPPEGCTKEVFAAWLVEQIEGLR